MGNNGSLIGTVLGVGFTLYALNQLNRFSQSQERLKYKHSECRYCGNRAKKERNKSGVFCSYCNRRLI
jgi:hypothetical protein